MNPNSQQQRAIEAIDGPVIIIAGPGTGKTNTLIQRILHLLESGNAKPSDMCVLTFTTKAALEIQNRLKHKIKILPPVQTFHGLSYSLIQNQLAEEKITTQLQRTEIVSNNKLHKKIAKTSVRDFFIELSKYKHAQALKLPIPTAWDEIISIYNNALKDAELIDYDDLLIKAFQQASENESQPFKYILVDEFQDTNRLQYELLKLLKPESNNIFAIGDPLQSIYAFQGAHPNIFDEFKKDFPQCLEIRLDINYRSRTHIVQTSSALFPDQPVPKAQNTDQARISIIQTLDEFTEAHYVISEIEKLIGGSDLIQASEMSANDSSRNIRFSDFAILYRNHHISKYVEEAMDRSAIPYQRIGAQSFYEHPRVVEILEHCEKIYIEDPNTEVKLNDLLDSLENESEKNDNSKYIQQLRSVCSQFDTSQHPLKAFFEHLYRIEELNYYDDRADKITLSTLHAAKGLEFTCVFIIGLDQGILPLLKSDSDIEEEKRLLYVGLTRAREYLYLLTTEIRAKKKQSPSQFFDFLCAENLIIQKDPAIEATLKKRQKWKDKKSQLKLF